MVKGHKMQFLEQNSNLLGEKFAVFSMDEFREVQRTLYDPDKEVADYFDRDFMEANNEYHMDYAWGPFIFSILKGIRVVVLS